MSKGIKSLTSGRVLTRSALWNFFGMAGPMLVALFAIPLLIEGMGKERFGILGIIWMGVGYFSLFDLGLGRALTKIVSERLGKGHVEGLGSLIWTALALLGLLGVIGSFLVLLLSEPLITRVLNVEQRFHAEAVGAFRILAVGLPVVVATTALIGLLQSHQRFGTIAAIRIPLGVLTFAGPLITLQFTPSLVWATVALLVSRSLALVVYFVVTSTVRSELRAPKSPCRTHIRPLLSFGGWLTVTNIVGPLMTYLDRFFVGTVLNMTAVTYYVTPYEVLSRLQMVPLSIMGVLFPAMATAYTSSRGRLVELYSTSAWILVFLMLPVTAGCFLLAPEALDLWLGEDFRIAATPVVQWLAVGWIINTLAQPAFTVLQSGGRPDLVAKVHLAELLPYLIMLWFFTSAFGIAGTAAAWSLRVFADTIILNELAGRELPELRSQIMGTRLAVAGILVCFGTAWFLDAIGARLVLLLLTIFGSGLALWPVITRLRQDGSAASCETSVTLS